MGTTIRPELSEKNPYWIERHRYYELKHFCLQYPIWKKAYAALDGLSRRPSDLEVFSKKGEISDPTVRCVEARSYYIERMKTVEQVAIATDAELSNYILKGVTEGWSYDILKARLNIPWQANVCLQLLIILLIHLNSSLHGSCSMRKKVITHARILEELREHPINFQKKKMSWKMNEQLMKF